MMKPLFQKNLFFCVTVFAASWIIPRSSFAGDALDLRADLWCPYTCDAESTEPGYLVEIAKSIFQKKGISIKYSTQSWARTLTEARTGKIDGAIGAGKSDEGLLFPSHHLGRSKKIVFSPRMIPLFNSKTTKI